MEPSPAPSWLETTDLHPEPPVLGVRATPAAMRLFEGCYRVTKSLALDLDPGSTVTPGREPNHRENESNEHGKKTQIAFGMFNALVFEQD